jgi:hypothetical protein
MLIKIAPEQKTRTNPLTGGRYRRAINLTRTQWHATWLSGSAVHETDINQFVNPVLPRDCDRIPELALNGGGTPGNYVIEGYHNGVFQTEFVATVAGATAKFSRPYDIVTMIDGPDPGATLKLYQGDLWLQDDCRCIYTGSAAGIITCALAGEIPAAPPVTYKATSVAAFQDWVRVVKQIDRLNTTLVGAEAIW